MASVGEFTVFDLTGGIHNGSDSVEGVGGFPFALVRAFDQDS